MYSFGVRLLKYPFPFVGGYSTQAWWVSLCPSSRETGLTAIRDVAGRMLFTCGKCICVSSCNLEMASGIRLM